MAKTPSKAVIAQEVANTKFTADVRPLLQLAKEAAGKKPKTFITDGAANFHEAYLKEFWTQNLDTRTEHIRHTRLGGDHNNNRMERFNGELRQRERFMRTLERPDTTILETLNVNRKHFPLFVMKRFPPLSHLFLLLMRSPRTMRAVEIG